VGSRSQQLFPAPGRRCEFKTGIVPRVQRSPRRIFMSHRVCPWWLGYFLIFPLRRWWQNPAEILEGYVRPGMTALEPGPGMGFFTLELLRLVGPSGRVIAVDIQPKMIERLKRRAAKAGLVKCLDARLASPESMALTDLAASVDFTLAFAVVHEFPDARKFFRQIAAVSKPGASLLLAEPPRPCQIREVRKRVECSLRERLRSAFPPIRAPQPRCASSEELRDRH
jgi:SAM-dependent methyltransferase